MSEPQAQYGGLSCRQLESQGKGADVGKRVCVG